MKIEKCTKMYYNWTFYLSAYVLLSYLFFNLLFPDVVLSGLVKEVAEILFLRNYIYFSVLWAIISIAYIIKLNFQRMYDKSLLVLPLIWMIPLVLFAVLFIISVADASLPEYMQRVVDLIIVLPIFLSWVLLVKKAGKKMDLDLSRVFAEGKKEFRQKD